MTWRRLWIVCIFGIMMTLLAPSAWAASNGDVKASVTPEGWVILESVSPATLRIFCQAPVDADILGCAIWVGPYFLTKPSSQCLVLLRRGLNAEDRQTTRELELRHCREGTYHDADNNEIPLELRQQLLEFSIPGLTR